MADDSNHPARDILTKGALADSRDRAKRLIWPGGLSARLLILTVMFVALAEALILAASLATFEERWLSDRVSRAELTTLTYEAAPDRVLTGTMRKQLKERSGVILVRVQRPGYEEVYAPAPAVMKTPYVIDLRRQNFIEWLAAPVRTLFSGAGSNVRVLANTATYKAPAFVEIVAPDTQLKAELVSYLLRLLGLTLFISAAAGAAVYVSLNVFLVRPIQRITLAMERFRADPDDPKAHIDPSGRRDEVGRAEVELNRMQADLRIALSSRARLAALGEAVAKINHDLRNMLTSAQLASERLALSGDPAMPRLERALDRAARLTTEVLAYGKSQEPVPRPAPLMLKTAVAAAAEDAGVSRGGVRFTTNLKAGDRVMADADHLHRILLNLLKNARQAVNTPEQRILGHVRLEFVQENGSSLLRISDNGPGVPKRALNRLFTPFTGSGRAGGTGLGLAIARELAQAHGGDVTLARTGPDGSMFEVALPGVLAAQTRVKRTKAAP